MPKRRCRACQSFKVVSWGINKSGSQRFRCSICGISFTVKRKDVTRRNQFSWLKRWLYGSTTSAIAKSSRRSPETIRRSLHWFLDHPPKPNKQCHLIIDATWFRKDHCLLVYWDHDLQRVQWWRYATGEYGFEIAEDLRQLRTEGVSCSSITSDGGRGLKTAVSWAYPAIPHQRCVVHVQRYGQALLTRNPKTFPGQQFKPLIQQLSKLETKKQANQWTRKVLAWEKHWDWFFKERTYLEGTRSWWYTHKSLRRVRALAVNAIPDLFHYLKDNNVPKTSNGLEGRFGSLKMHYRQHRGLSKRRRKAYLAWYLTVVVNGEKPTRFDY